MRTIFLLILSFHSYTTFSQTVVELANNEMKYWKLRARLTGDHKNRDIYNGFLSVGPYAGQSIPSAIRVPQRDSWYYYYNPEPDPVHYPGESGPCNMQYLTTIWPWENNTVNGSPKLDNRDGQSYRGFIEWGDATIDLGWYIAILATEWELLHRNGASTSQTEEELYYALKAIERLDYFAESLYTLSPDLNGFISRDDVPEYFALSKFGKNIDLVSSGASCFNRIDNPNADQKEKYDCDNKNMNLPKLRSNVMSVDQVVGLIMGMALVKKFVPTYATYNSTSLRTLNSDITHRILNYVKKGGTTNWWNITDPEDKRAVCRGHFAIQMSAPLARIGKYITGNNYTNPAVQSTGRPLWDAIVFHYKNSPTGNYSIHIPVPLTIGTKLGIPALSFYTHTWDWYEGVSYNAAMFLKLAALSGAANTLLDPAGRQWIKNVSNAHHMEIFDLLGGVMLGYSPVKPSSFWRNEFNQLNCGCNCFQINNSNGYLGCENYINNIGTGAYGPWNVRNRWKGLENGEIGSAISTPGDGTNPSDNINSIFEYPGMDYMLAYNLYRIKYYKTSGYSSKIRRIVSNGSLPFNFPGTTFSGPFTLGGDQYPLDVKAVFSIESDNISLNQDANMHFYAGSEIVLKAGFHAKPGSVFTSKIQEYDCTPNYYNVGSLEVTSYKTEDSLSGNTFLDDIDTTEDILLETFEYEEDSVVYPDAVFFDEANDTLFSTLNPNYTFTDSGTVIYTPIGNKTALDKATFENIILYPNPTNGDASLEYTLYQNGEVKIEVTNELGQIMGSITEAKTHSQSKGKHKITLHTNKLASGIYFCIVDINGRKETKKFTVSR